jgi:hypothetical protein
VHFQRRLGVLQSIGIPSTAQVDEVFIQFAPLVTDLSALSQSTAVHGLIVSNTGGTSLVMPNVTTLEALSILRNPSLTTLALPNLTSVTSPYNSYIAGNTSLSNCQATMIRDHVTVEPAYMLVVTGNAPDVCP